MKNLLKPLLIVAVAILTFSCSPEDTIENVEDQTKRGGFIGDDDSTPGSSVNVTPVVNTQRYGIQLTPCPDGTSDYDTFGLKVNRGILNSNGNNPKLEVIVGIRGYNNSNQWVSWGTKVLYIEVDQLSSPFTFILDSDLENPNQLGGQGLDINEVTEFKVLSVRETDNQTNSNVYVLNSSVTTVGCGNN